MKWLPHSMAGQLLALLLLAVGLSHFIAVLMVSQWRTPDEIHPVAAHAIETRVASVYAAVARQPSQAPALLAALSQPDAVLSIDDDARAGALAMDAQEAAMAERLRGRTGLAAGQVQVRLRPAPAPDATDADDGFEAMDPESDLSGSRVLDVALALPDGRWLCSRQWPVMLHGHWKKVLGFSIPVGLLPITLIAIVFGRRIMRPLQALTDAARRLSRGEQVQPLRPQGPSDLRELAESFNDMQQRLGRFINDRTRMIAAIGHDLRTPLTSLRIRAELIEDPELRAAMIATLDDMVAISEETLQFARDDARHEPTREVDLGALVAAVAKQHADLGRAVSWEVPAGLLYRCRPVHLKRALDNLVDNAARHGRTQVRLREDAQQQELRIEVEDDGPGIAPELIEQAFEPFVTLDPARNREGGGGGGLGLAIARSSVRAHGGDVSLHNRAGGGLRAVVTLPF